MATLVRWPIRAITTLSSIHTATARTEPWLLTPSDVRHLGWANERVSPSSSAPVTILEIQDRWCTRHDSNNYPWVRRFPSFSFRSRQRIWRFQFISLRFAKRWITPCAYQNKIHNYRLDWNSNIINSSGDVFKNQLYFSGHRNVSCRCSNFCKFIIRHIILFSIINFDAFPNQTHPQHNAV